MTHLGDRLTPLVDQQLPPADAERALSHVAGCAECHEAVELERLTKARLAALCAPAPDDALVERLLHLAAPGGPVPPRPGHVPGSPRPQAAPRPAGRRPVRTGPAGRPHPSRRRARLRVTVAVGSLVLVGAGLAGGAILASGGSPGPGVVPPVDTFVTDHQRTTGELPFTDRSGQGAAEPGR